ncbi:hypothetical protein CEP54_015408 [Fusarium duplospermum]|uniref:Clr5 domain-containing protein n=1 Tax=Fusarium duplospermum TaxID=1325734 RepID=A0A428NPC9_9HYPO|nr:hypothetical protein CEP54_015408 [Fusarium duplospermum]
MTAHKTTDSTPPSRNVSHTPESNVEAVSSPKTQNDGLLQTIYSPPVSPMSRFFGPSQDGADFNLPWDIDPSQPSLFQCRLGIDLTTAEPTQLQPTHEWLSMNPTFDPTQVEVVQGQMLIDSAEEPTQPQSTRDQSPMNLTREPEALEQYKGFIRSQYLDHGQSVSSVLDKLKSQNINATKHRLEERLKRWGFFKKIKKRAWRYLDYKIRKRKDQGKDSEVVLSGKVLDISQTIKGTKDNHKSDTLTLVAQRLSSPSPPTQPYLHLGTPPPLPMDFEWPKSLPWQIFKKKFQTLAGEFEQFDSSHGILTIVFAQTNRDAFAQPRGLDSRTFISRLATDIGMVMPDENREDLLYTIQDMQENRTRGSVFHCLRMIIYHLSNNLLELDTPETCSLFFDGLRNIGILGPRMHLRDLRDEDTTVKAFVENLFQKAIDWVVKETITDEQTLELIKLLLSSGQDPNLAFWIPGLDNNFTPLQAAALMGHTELVKLLLEFGAKDNRNNPLGESAASLAMVSEVSGAIKWHIVDAILESGSSVNWEELLLTTIQQRDMDLVKDVLGWGPDVTKASRDYHSPIFEKNALSFAISAGKDFVKEILVYAQTQGNLEASFITPDVFIAAAIEGDAETIRHLHSIRSIGSCENQHHITPLRAAVSAGQRSTCEVLLDLYGGLSPVLLFLAAFRGHEDLLRFLLHKGVDVNATIDWDNCGECVRVSGGAVDRFKAGQSPTALRLLKSVRSGQWHLYSNCIAILIEGGARLEGDEVYLFAKQRLVEPLLAALARDGTLDKQDSSGESALQAAFAGFCNGLGMGFTQRRVEIVKFLLKSGAKLSGGEVVSAIRCKDVELFTLLTSSRKSFQDNDGSGMSALEAAILSGHPTLIEQVLPSYADHYDPGSLCAAVREQHPYFIDSLLTNRPPLAAYDALEGTAVGIAAMFGDVNLLQKLLNHFQDVWEPNSAFLPPLSKPGRYYNPFWRRSTSTSPELSKTSPLSFAAFCTGREGFRILLDRGCRADLFTWTVIADKENLPCLKLLIEHGQRLNGLSLSASVNKPPLCIAIERKNTQMVKYLLEAGVNVNHYDCNIAYSRSPLQLAVELGDWQLASSLIDKGADINAPPSVQGGATALQLAAMKGYIVLARLLLVGDARVNDRGAKRYGRTALEGAAEHGRLDMLELLIEHRALAPGNGRCQVIRAVKLATGEGHHTIAEQLRQRCKWTEEDEDLFVNGDFFGLEVDFEDHCCCDEIGCIYNLSESENIESEGGYTEGEETCGTGSDMED